MLVRLIKRLLSKPKPPPGKAYVFDSRPYPLGRPGAATCTCVRRDNAFEWRPDCPVHGREME